MKHQSLSAGKRISIRFLGTLALLLCSLAHASASKPKVGDRPPALGLEKLLQTPPEARASWEALKGKVVVLEFWATWCGPCVAAFPHLNGLADQFKDRPVQFIAITDESDSVVRPFLKKKPIHAWVGLDTDRSMLTAYGVKYIPHTVVVDPEGKIAAITRPTILTAQHLEDLLAGETMLLPAPERRPFPSSVLDEARELEEQGEYAKALEKYLWFHRHALEHDSTAAGVRVSFALGAWARLGEE